MRPRARSAGLVIRDLPDEVVVYDTRSHRAHCLNPTAALVFRRADGRRTVTEIAAFLGPGADHAVVHAALDQLAAAGLLETCPAPRAPASSRRHVLRQVGLGAALLAPVVTSLLVPTPAQAAATCIPVASCTAGNVGQPCYNSNPATECSLNVCQGPGSCTP
jgi:Coenzyme PQQ synthesis protein D (PqqD)